MREYDEMSTGDFWARRKARMQNEAKKDAEWANSPIGKREAATKTANFLLTKGEGQRLTEAEEQELATALQILEATK